MAFPRYLSFPQWKSDQVVFEIASQVSPQPMLLARLGTSLPPRAQLILQQQQCKLKRFLVAAKADFEITGPTGVEMVRFIGSEQRLVDPGHRTRLGSEEGLNTAEVNAEVAAIFAKVGRRVHLSEIGARLRPDTRVALKVAHTRLQTFLTEQPNLYSLEGVTGKEIVQFLGALRKSSSASSASTATSPNGRTMYRSPFDQTATVGMSQSSSQSPGSSQTPTRVAQSLGIALGSQSPVGSITSHSGSESHMLMADDRDSQCSNYAQQVRGVIMTHQPSDLESLLISAMPLYYED